MARTLRAEHSVVHDWFRRHGLISSPVAGGTPVLIADEIEIADLTVRRLWHTPLILEPVPKSVASGSRTLVLQAEGHTAFGFTDSAELRIDTGAAVAYPHERLARVSASEPSARIEIVSARHPIESPVELPGADDGPAWRALASTVNSILNSEPSVTPATRVPLRQALESLVVALIAGRAGAERPSLTLARSAEATFAAALALVHEQAADPVFTVEALAAALGVSRQYLARVFARHGVTPREVLRRRRLDVAEGLLSMGHSVSEAARRSGFSSSRAFARARQERDAQRYEP